MKNGFCHALPMILGLALGVRAQSAVPGLDEILKQVDLHRGLERSYQADLEIRQLDQGRETAANRYRLMVRFRGENRDILLETLAPANERGNLILSRDGRMWVLTRKTSRPIPISAQQRLLGDAAVGDILDIDLRRRYGGTVTKKGDALELALDAKEGATTYDRVDLRVDALSLRPMEAVFRTRSGKAIKTQKFLSFARQAGRDLAHEMEILDAIETSRSTRIRLANARFATFPESHFDKDHLRDLQTGR